MRSALAAGSSIVSRACIQLTPRHIPDAFALSSIAGWNQTLEDWQLLLKLSDACYGIEVEGQLAATATLVCYGQTLAWLGMVLTHPDFRRSGFARALVNRAMQQAKVLGIQTVKLDATNAGRPLYESLGFSGEQKVERWQRAPRAGQSPGGARSPCISLDAAACGCNRSQLLMHLTNTSNAASPSDGYSLDRPGRLNRYLGPSIALSPQAARSLIEETIARHPGTGWFWDLLPANRTAVAIAHEPGFERVRTLTRMSWGRELREKTNQIFALAGLELG